MKRFEVPKPIDIVLVESPDQTASFSNALKSGSPPFHHSTFYSLAEARNHISRKQPDLIIADLHLPDGNGVELLTDGNKLLPCPLVILAEESSQPEAFEALRQGASEYILKDVTPACEIHRIIQRVLSDKNFAQEFSNTQQALLESQRTAKSSYKLIGHILKGTASKRGKDFLNSLSQQLALALKVPYAGIGKLNYPDKETVTTLAFWKGDDWGESFTYDLKDTPCATVFEKKWSIYPENANKLFPEDQILIDMGIESYLGIALYDESDKPIGILWVMDTKPFREVAPLQETMTIFAARAETELQILLLEKTHRLSESVSQSILDSVVDGIITIDENGIIDSFNRSAETIFGYSQEEVTGKNISMLMPEPYSSQHDDYLRQYINGGVAKIIGIGREVTGLRKNGTSFPLDLAVSEVHLEGKRFFTGIIRNITERKKAENEIIEAKKEAEKASLEKSEFLSRMSHELRTPLNSIMGFSQLLEVNAAQGQYPENQISYIEQVLKAGSHLLDLINEVLDLARVESGAIEIQLESVHLPTLLTEMITLIQPTAEQNNITIVNKAELNGHSNVMADRAHLKQCLLNLLSNAVKYNCVNGNVSLHCQTTNPDKFQICVTDTGPGLSEKQQARLFEPFERLGAEHSEVEGTGIGLTITQKMVEQMGGTIGYETAPGKGSTFYIELPHHVEPDPEPAPPVPQLADTPPKDKKNISIFYIEDNASNLMLVEHSLARFPNYQLKSATTGNQGLRSIKKDLPDLILLDMGLPDMEGLDVLRELKNDPATQNIPVVVLSANAIQSYIDQARELGIECYMTKPIEIQKLIKIIEQFTR